MDRGFRILPAFPLLVAVPTAWAQTSLFELVDIRRIERAELPVEIVELDPPIERAPEAFFDAKNAPPPPDPSLDRAISQLGLDAEGFLRVPIVQQSALMRVASPLIQLDIAGRRIRMAAIEIKRDADFDAAHYTLLATDSDDYARFTVSRSGPEIVGTVFLGNAEYRILPDTEGYQLVHPVVAHSGAWRRENSADLRSRAGLLEARHLQVGWVADRQPASFRTQDDGRPNTYADGPSLGKLNFWSALSFSPAGEGVADTTILATETETFLNRVPYFTWMVEPIQVRVNEIDSYNLTAISNNGLTVTGVQLINDIPISEPFVLQMSPSTDVMLFRGTLARRDMAPPYDRERILSDEARLTSALAVVQTYGIEVTEEILSEELVYQVVSSSALELVWSIERQVACGLKFRIDIDAISGSSRVRVTDNAGIDARTTDEMILRCRFLRRFMPPL